MTKKITKSQVDAIVHKINDAVCGESIWIDLPEFNGNLTFLKGFTQSRLVYKGVNLVTISYTTTPLFVTVQSEPYTHVFTYILPLITRLLYAKMPLISGRLEIP